MALLVSRPTPDEESPGMPGIQSRLVLGMAHPPGTPLTQPTSKCSDAEATVSPNKLGKHKEGL